MGDANPGTPSGGVGCRRTTGCRTCRGTPVVCSVANLAGHEGRSRTGRRRPVRRGGRRVRRRTPEGVPGPPAGERGDRPRGLPSRRGPCRQRRTARRRHRRFGRPVRPRVGSGRPSERGDGGPPPPSTFIRIRRSSPWFFRTVSGSSSRLSSSAGGFSAIASWSGRLRSWTLQRDVAGISHRPGSGVGFSPPWVAERVDPRSHQHVHRSRPT